MVFGQRLFQSQSQQRSKDNGNDGVEGGGGELADDTQERGIRSQSLLQQTTVEVALGQIQSGIDNGADCCSERRLQLAVILLPEHQTNGKTVCCPDGMKSYRQPTGEV